MFGRQAIFSTEIIAMAFQVQSIKSLFPVFTHWPELVYLDNAATSQKPQSVIQTITDFYSQENANVHRGLYELSSQATRRYEEVRKKVAGLLGANDPSTIAFTKGTTESINIVAQGYLKKFLKKGDKVLISGMEHHANLIPWQQVCMESGTALEVIPVTSDGELLLDKLNSRLDKQVKLLALTHISNVLGTINPIEEVIAMAHQKKIPVLIDAAQSVGHHHVDVNKLDIDFLVFSAHKMFGPMGTGVLYCKKEFAEKMDARTYGGGGIRNVTYIETEFLDYPHKLEAGTPNVPGVLGLGAAVDFVNGLDLTETTDYTRNLIIYFKEKAKSLGWVELLGNPRNFGSIVSFQIKNIHAHDVAGFLANSGIAVRAGHHCAQPLLESMGIPATVRASFSIYSTKQDVDKTVQALVELKKFWS